LYSVLGHPNITCQLVRRIAREFYTAKPDGIPGNDDAGQMSAWLIYAALGLYPVNPASGHYILGCPAFDAPFQLKKFIVTVEGSGFQPTYYFRGMRLDRQYLTHDELVTGGELHVVLT
jgi:putative alpha-1,2-mannosidase